MKAPTERLVEAARRTVAQKAGHLSAKPYHSTAPPGTCHIHDLAAALEAFDSRGKSA